PSLTTHLPYTTSSDLADVADVEAGEGLVLDVGVGEDVAAAEGDELLLGIQEADLQGVVDGGGVDVDALHDLAAGIDEGEGGGGDAVDAVGGEADLDGDGGTGGDLGGPSVAQALDLGAEVGAVGAGEVAERDGGGDVEVVGAADGPGAELADHDVAEVEFDGIADEAALGGGADEADLALAAAGLVG